MANTPLGGPDQGGGHPQQHQPPRGPPPGMGLSEQFPANLPFPLRGPLSAPSAAQGRPGVPPPAPMAASSGMLDSEFEGLVNQMATLNVSAQQPSDCPMCSQTLPLIDFAKHVVECVDKAERMDPQALARRSEYTAQRLSKEEGFADSYGIICPVCGRRLQLGESMNLHVNDCLDGAGSAPLHPSRLRGPPTGPGPVGLVPAPASRALPPQPSSSRWNFASSGFRPAGSDALNAPDSAASDATMAPPSSPNPPASGMDVSQLAACARAIVTEGRRSGVGSREYVDVVASFERLGINKENLRAAIQHVDAVERQRQGPQSQQPTHDSAGPPSQHPQGPPPGGPQQSPPSMHGAPGSFGPPP